MSNRLPFVVTNPPKDLVLLDSDLLFVLGRPSYHERSSKVATPGDVEEVASEDETSDSDLEEGHFGVNWVGHLGTNLMNFSVLDFV
eukprot:symbB.v1.2.029290.t1/scaffold3189.1/size61648/2